MTDLLPGLLVYVFGVSIVDAALLSWMALLWYRRSVRRLMREGAPPPGSAADAARSSGLVDRAAPGEEQDFPLYEEPSGPSRYVRGLRRDGFRRVVIAYSAGAAVYAAIVTTLKFAGESPPLPPVAWLAEWWTNTWPIVPTLVFLLVLDRPRMLRLLLVYLVAGALAIVLFTSASQLLRGTLDSAPLTNVFWAMVSLAWSASIPLVLVALTAWRRVRAVMPLALAGTLLFGFGAIFFRELLVRALSIAGFRSLFLDSAAFSSVQTVQYLLFMIVSLPVGWVAWRLLTILADAFARKRFSDVQLVIDCWWAVVAAEATATHLAISHGFLGIAGGIAAFAGYRLAVSAGLRGVRRPQAAPRRLLLLRVFGYQARTESLFDRVAQAWRFHGPVQLIAGVDLAMRTADPGDVLALLDGRLADLYVRGLEDVPERLARLDLAPDPDGRFRINEIYCRENTWRPTLEALLDASDAVLMDLRSFSAGNAGCIFEIEQLVSRLPSDGIVLVCDETTDMPLLRRVLGGAWAAARSAGRTRGDGRISVVRVERQSRSEFDALMRRLIAAPHTAGA